MAPILVVLPAPILAFLQKTFMRDTYLRGWNLFTWHTEFLGDCKGVVPCILETVGTSWINFYLNFVAAWGYTPSPHIVNARYLSSRKLNLSQNISSNLPPPLLWTIVTNEILGKSIERLIECLCYLSYQSYYMNWKCKLSSLIRNKKLFHRTVQKRIFFNFCQFS